MDQLLRDMPVYFLILKRRDVVDQMAGLLPEGSSGPRITNNWRVDIPTPIGAPVQNQVIYNHLANDLAWMTQRLQRELN